MSNYVIYYSGRKSMYRSLAQQWKTWSEGVQLSEEQVRGMSLFFRCIGKRFGLITEFKDIGVV